jgi:enoyl-CoA hydratase/carnithine racemase
MAPYTARYSPDQFETMSYRVADHVAVVTLSRPKQRNAINRRAYAELESAFLHVQSDPDVRCAIITGVDPAFCSGDDVREILAGDDKEQTVSRLSAVSPGPTPAAEIILSCDRPIIAAVNGAAVGWGMELSLFADIRIASDKAKFGELFIKRGLVSDVGGIWRLPAVVGASKAAELLFTGDVIDADEAKAIGLVSRIAPHEELMEQALAMAGRIAINPPLALRYMKDGLRRAAYGDVREIGNWVSNTLGVLMKTEDHKEGVQSFLEKREPNFSGN